MALEFLTDGLAEGFFVSRAGDFERARQLAEGRVTLQGREFAVHDPTTYDTLAGMSPRLAQELHTLRWLDALRRERDVVPGAIEAWMRAFDAWARSGAARDGQSAAWSEWPLEQRSVAVALMGSQVAVPREWLVRHHERLDGVASPTSSASRRLRILHIRLLLQQQLGGAPDLLRRMAAEAAIAAFGSNGYAVAEDLSRLRELAEAWEDTLTRLGIREDDDALSRVRSLDFWVHAASPKGKFIDLGSGTPVEFPRSTDSRIRYVASMGADGTAPNELVHADPEGLVAVRSGWGETERGFDAETLMTILVGPVRGRSAHQDVSRLTYDSQGQQWLVDPLSIQMAANDAHSVLVVPDAQYRSRGRATLAHQYTRDDTYGFVIQNNVYPSVRWQRHVVFVRTNNFVVVEDQVRASRASEAYIQWVLAPDVDISPSTNGFYLRAGRRTVFLGILASSFDSYSIGEVRGDDGDVLAKTVRIPLNASKGRVLSVISDVVDETQFGMGETARTRDGFVVAIRDANRNESVAVTREVSLLPHAGERPESAVSRALGIAADGGQTLAEVLHQRVGVRTAIVDAKSLIRLGNESREARLEGLILLERAAKSLRIEGSRDHGLSAAMIDIQCTDLPREGHTFGRVMIPNRGPLRAWAGKSFVQPKYRVPVYTSLHPETLPIGLQEPCIWSVDLGQLVLSSHISDGPGDVLTVYFHGATDRHRYTMPRYERLRSLSGLEAGPVMIFSDPSLDLDGRMILSWFVGTEAIDVHDAIARMVSTFARKRGIAKVVLVGNSGGGFAALQVGARLDGARVLAFGPQIRIDDYIARLSEAAHLAAFGRVSVADDARHASRMDLILRYKAIEFDQRVTYIQNISDHQHFADHFAPFKEAFEDSKNAEKLRVLTPDLGPGHRVPPPEQYNAYIRAEIARSEGEWSLKGLRHPAK